MKLQALTHHSIFFTIAISYLTLINYITHKIKRRLNVPQIRQTHIKPSLLHTLNNNLNDKTEPFTPSPSP